MSKKGLTCNEIMVLLDIYRGTFDASRHMGTVLSDLNRLRQRGLIAGVTVITSRGEEFVRWIRAVTSIDDQFTGGVS